MFFVRFNYSPPTFLRRLRHVFSFALLTALAVTGMQAASAAPSVPLLRDIPTPEILAKARLVGPLDRSTQIRIAFVLPLRNQDELHVLLNRLSDPNDILYRHYLTSDEFAARFGSTQTDYDAVIAYAKSLGLTVTGTYSNHTLIDVSGSAGTLENAFGVKLNRYTLLEDEASAKPGMKQAWVMKQQRLAYANDSAPRVTPEIANKIVGVIGLTNISLFKQRNSYRAVSLNRFLLPHSTSKPNFGNGPSGGLAPADIKKVYNLDTVTLDGKGQTLGLYELDGYDAANIAKYVTQFQLPIAGTAASLTNILVDGYSGAAGANTVEVVLDIDMMLALTPKASILVYEGTNGTVAVMDVYTKIASDNLAKSVSASWGNAEGDVQTTERLAEDTAFQQMSAQGQSIYVSSGDYGAYTDKKTVSADYPAGSPYVTGVGGTRLSFNTDGSWLGETTWGDPTDTRSSPFGAGGGGGVSAFYAKPDYQLTDPGTGVSSPVGISATNRNLPDISLNADPNTGYDIYAGGWGIVGGTSASAPLWAAFTGLVNEQLAAAGGKTLGFANVPIYTLGRDPKYTTYFHDIADNSTNLFYHATVGYDNATGWGSFIGDTLLNALAPTEIKGLNGTLSGIITDASTGAPVAGATIEAVSSKSGIIYSPNSPVATTGADGKYSISIPSLISYRIIVDFPYKAPTINTGPTPLYYAGETATGVTVNAGDTPSVTTLNFALPQSHVFPSGTQFVSAPYDYTTVADFAALFDLVAPLQQTDPKLEIWQADIGTYLAYPSAPADTFHIGYGYWVKFPSVGDSNYFPAYLHQVPVDQTRSTTTNIVPLPGNTQSVSVKLQAGWNQIGDPFGSMPNNDVPVPLSSIQVDSATTPGSPKPLTSSPLITQPLYAYNSTTGSYVQLGSGDSLHTWNGYWIEATAPATLIFQSSK